MERIQVTCAIIVQDDKILACQKRDSGDHALEWEFPGGKIEKGETAEECILREIREELNVKVQVVRVLNAIQYDYSRKSICLLPFMCEIVEGQIRLKEHKAFVWFAIDDFEQLKWCLADVEVFRINKESIQ